MTENVHIRIWRYLEELGKRAWVPILLVSVTGLFFTILTYCTQRAANKPELAVATANIVWNQNAVRALFNFANTGRKTARRGTATLYTFTNNSGVKLGGAPIIGSGPNVMPGFGGNSDMTLIVKDQPREFLLCIAYFDEAGSEYKQSFLLQRDDELSSTTDSQLKEIAPFNSNLCANQPP